MKRTLKVGDRIRVTSGLFADRFEEVIRVEGNRATTDGLRVFHRNVWYGGRVYLYRRKPTGTMPDFILEPTPEP